jgi:hypothetical protein
MNNGAVGYFHSLALWVSLNHDKTEKAENPFKSRQQFKTKQYEKVRF